MFKIIQKSRLLIICIVIVIIKIYLELCHYFYKITLNYIVDPSGNIIEHFYMFLLAFIITYYFHKTKNENFGYHTFKITKVLKYLLIISIICLCFSLINALFGIKFLINNNLLWVIIFQLFFSGLGEEIVFRSIPINIFDKFISGNTDLIIINKFKIDLSVFLSAIIFVFFHISYYLTQPIYSMIYNLFYIFIIGIMLGWMYRRFDSIWLCMIIHGISNVLLFVFPILSGIFFI